MVCCEAYRSGFKSVKMCAWQYTTVVPTGTIRYGGYKVKCPKEENVFLLFARGELFVEDENAAGSSKL